MLPLGGVALAGALVVGLVAWLASSQPAGFRFHLGGQRTVQEAPFEAALFSLAAAPELQYQGVVPRVGQVDVQVTDHDEMVGTITSNGQSYGVLRVGGKLYVKPPSSGLPGVTDPAKAAALKGKWLTGQDVSSLLGSLPSQLVSPPQLATRLVTALRDTRTLPAPGDPGSRVDGVAALMARTPLGDLYVTRNQPYRIVRLTPSSAAGPASANASAWPARGRSRAGAILSVAVRQAAAQDAAAQGTAAMDFPEEQPGDIAKTYQELQDQTRQLSNAIDTDLQFTLQGNGVIQCSDGGCQITVTVSNTAAATSSGGTITSGSVAAQLSATVDIAGEAAGGCTSSGQLPLNGTGTMACTDAQAGPVFAAAEAQDKAKAQAQSQAEGGAPVPYYLHYAGQYYVYATAQVNVGQLVQTERQEAAEDQQQNPCDSLTSAARAPTAGRTAVLARDVESCKPVQNRHPERLGKELQQAESRGVKPIKAGTPAFQAATSRGGTYLWSVDVDGVLRIIPDDSVIHHPVLTAGGPVIGAGEVTIERGVVRKISNATGHYTPPSSCSMLFLQNGVDAFMQAGIPVLRRGITDLGGLP